MKTYVGLEVTDEKLPERKLYTLSGNSDGYHLTDLKGNTFNLTTITNEYVRFRSEDGNTDVYTITASVILNDKGSVHFEIENILNHSTEKLKLTAIDLLYEIKNREIAEEYAFSELGKARGRDAFVLDTDARIVIWLHFDESMEYVSTLSEEILSFEEFEKLYYFSEMMNFSEEEFFEEYSIRGLTELYDELDTDFDENFIYFLSDEVDFLDKSPKTIKGIFDKIQKSKEN